ncbi:translation factor Sua5 [Hylemonella gracilis str. Niagara R]|uniref:Threonylcarbamoyl-AMP synthase n=1 Tax=Hylemonella gracilis str. Niagara R TaxID=1458275 RepID=A0A016XEH5_9BURK|nr:L-threonylcarbamoyladenylate synthase [Hylemonella gracilis]EYC49967.1 translation factor Sua5 [Hylemonella gracilis str. Niagara R]
MILDGRDPSAVQRAARALSAGELLGLPTETVYGLAADAGSDAAVAKIYAAKGRPPGHPLIVHLADESGMRPGLAHFAAEVPAYARLLVDAFWPGPLTLILPRRAGVAAAAAGGQDSIGLRCPAHPVAQAVLQAAKALGVAGLAAPSANLFGRVSPTTAAHVQAEFGEGLLILDGGPCEVGIESTIVDCTRGAPVLLRPGQITRLRIDEVLQAAGTDARLRDTDEIQARTAQAAPRASGMLESHYAPRAKVRLMDAVALESALAAALINTNSATSTGDAATARMAVYARTPLRLPAGVVHRPMPPQASAVAHELFAALRALDEAGVREIWVETPPDTADWEGVSDRLRRAAA